MIDERQSQAEGRQSRTAGGRSLLARQPLTDERRTRDDERWTLVDGRWADALRTQHGEGQYRDGERRSLYAKGWFSYNTHVVNINISDLIQCVAESSAVPRLIGCTDIC